MSGAELEKQILLDRRQGIGGQLRGEQGMVPGDAPHSILDPCTLAVLRVSCKILVYSSSPCIEQTCVQLNFVHKAHYDAH